MINDTLIDTHDYPTRWKDYIGQDPAKSMLQVAAKSAKLRKEPLGHVLIAHPTPGIGKTSLALLISQEMGTTCRVVSGQLNVGKARMLFADMEDRDVLFVDEIHRIFEGGKKNGEWLLHYLQDGVLMGPLGWEVQPRVTLVGATTDAGKLPVTVADRFELLPPMEEYSDEEAVKIVKLIGSRVLANLPPVRTREAEAIARATANNPRRMRRLLKTLRDLTITETLPLVNGHYDVPALIRSVGITEDGLDRTAQQYLRTLYREFDGTAGAKNLEDRLGQAGGLADTERVLMDKGLIAKKSAGRTLTQAGILRSRALVSV